MSLEAVILSARSYLAVKGRLMRQRNGNNPSRVLIAPTPSARIYGQLTGNASPTAEKLRENGWLALRAGLPIANNPRIGRELLIVREGGVTFLVEALQQQEARRRGEGLTF